MKAMDAMMEKRVFLCFFQETNITKTFQHMLLEDLHKTFVGFLVSSTCKYG